ncbi:hypothetical protein L0Y26_06850 [Pectobacterium aroidearum]|uniref:hypothetical protein n=1 Tax=Pectobacterium aroidearum TaxID=1201031 RepID=UPI0021151B91|nr:hypothetical protein [Pectobacterium aroidearum]UUE37631.1 hypothetical protein L0Y26_06850 [Pectobacterium aroidearum]UUE42007.1 hypothetical protein L0Y25_06850 [Pectobacterium aroidearum]
MHSDNNDAHLAVFSGEFSVSDDAWTLDAVRWGFVEKKKIIANLKGKMGSGPFNAEIELLWREEFNDYFGRGEITYDNYRSEYKTNGFAIKIMASDIYLEDDICVIDEAEWLENGYPYAFYGDLERVGH